MFRFVTMADEKPRWQRRLIWMEKFLSENPDVSYLPEWWELAKLRESMSKRGWDSRCYDIKVKLNLKPAKVRRLKPPADQ